jgi:hypothetical protein
MRLLSFMDIPVVEGKEPSPIERRTQLEAWANGEKVKLSAAFLAYENDGSEIDDYLFQIGYIKNDCLVTNAAVIKQVGDQCKEYKTWKSYMKIYFEIQRHLELYFSKINIVPPWGTSEFSELKEKGFTSRVLIGPHKAGGLRPNQEREVIIDASNNIIFGPLR